MSKPQVYYGYEHPNYPGEKFIFYPYKQGVNYDLVVVDKKAYDEAIMEMQRCIDDYGCGAYERRHKKLLKKLGEG